MAYRTRSHTRRSRSAAQGGPLDSRSAAQGSLFDSRSAAQGGPRASFAKLRTSSLDSRSVSKPRLFERSEVTGCLPDPNTYPCQLCYLGR
jgi:hypothetical protein